MKRLAHTLKPIVHIGASGVTEAASDAVREAFGARELLKVKVHRTAPRSAREAGEELVRQVDGAHLVQVIGRTIVLYRPDPESPTIELPP